MNRRQFLRDMAVSGVALAAANTPGFGADKPQQKPNLVFVFSDQQSWDMLGCYGNKDLVTPNLDHLASEGIRFNHCISNSPICTPYRAMLLSGQHTLRNGAIGNDIRMVAGHGNYFAEVLRDNGYHTGYYGKWHLYGGNRNRPIPPGPYRYGFDHEFLSNNCTLVFDKKRAYYWDEDGKKQKYGEWEPYGQTHQAVEFINRHADDDKPFALFLSWHPPHGPYNLVPDDLKNLYDPAKLHLRPNGPDSPRIRRDYRNHMAMISGLDRAFGDLMQALKDKGLDDNTILIFTSDHGDALGSHGNRKNKMRPEQESIRVPLLVRYPDQLKPRVSDLLVGTLDLMPTLLGMMQLPIPKTCDGRDLSRAIAQGNDDAVDAAPIFLPSRDFRGVYTRRYTYCYDSATGGDFEYRDSKHPPSRFAWNVLYDRKVDPHEKKNLYDSPDYKEIREQLHARTRAWMKKVGDEGWSYQEIIATCAKPEDKPGHRNGGKVGSGVLKGSPIELLTSTKD